MSVLTDEQAKFITSGSVLDFIPQQEYLGATEAEEEKDEEEEEEEEEPEE